MKNYYKYLKRTVKNYKISTSIQSNEVFKRSGRLQNQGTGEQKKKPTASDNSAQTPEKREYIESADWTNQSVHEKFLRRNFLRAGAITGIGALGISMTGNAVGETRVVEEYDNGSLDVNDNFRLLDNQWGNPEAAQGVWITENGSYGWDFDASNTSSGINYPEVFIGTRPWGSDTGTEFPIQRRNVSEFILDIQADYDISDGEWD